MKTLKGFLLPAALLILWEVWFRVSGIQSDLDCRTIADRGGVLDRIDRWHDCHAHRRNPALGDDRA